MTLFSKMILKLAFLFLAFLTQASVSFAQTRSTVLYETANGLIAAPRSFFFTNILAGTNLIIYTNGNGTITIAGTVVGGGGGSLTTNGNQFGTNIVLTIKDGALLTNVVVYGNNTNALRINSGVITSSLPAIDISQTWSNSGVNFESFRINVLGITNGSSSYLLNLQTNNSSTFAISPSGNILARGSSSSLLTRIAFGTTSTLSAPDGTVYFSWGNNGPVFPLGLHFSAALDTFLVRDSAATLQLGADSATATAQTLKAHDGSGTDKAGADLSIAGGQGTGAGVGGNVILRTATAGASGSSANSYSNRVVIGQDGGVTINPSRTNALTINSGVITSSLPAINISQTWSNSGVTFTGLKLNVTDTSSSAFSYHLQLRRNGADEFLFRKLGVLSLVDLETYSGGAITGNRRIILGENGTGIRMSSTYQLSWSANGSGGDAYQANDLFLSRDSAATLQLGIDAATATAQTIKAHDGSGTDKDGADLNLSGGKGTGTGVGGMVKLNTSLSSGASGSGQGTLSPRVVVPPNIRVLTDDTANLIATFTFSGAGFASIEVLSGTYAYDGSADRISNTDANIFTVIYDGSVFTVNNGAVNQAWIATSATTMSTTMWVQDDGSGNLGLYVTPTILVSGWSIWNQSQFRVNSTTPVTVTTP